ncbi:MAG: hypothetical protein MUC31_00765 [Bacteroidales bacterium]|jgi:hypothetical protein|nr:hypothetical protein [Bacteroidales bacterium]
MKKLTILALITFAMVSAGTLFAQDKKTTLSVTASAEPQVTLVTPEKFQDFAAENVGKEVEISGMVVHVCKHGGKKMFIVGEDPEMRVKITVSEKVTVFEPELEGSVVNVVGVVEPIEEEVVPEEEKATEDTDHKNYYHKPQYAVSCLKFKTIEE